MFIRKSTNTKLDRVLYSKSHPYFRKISRQQTKNQVHNTKVRAWLEAENPNTLLRARNSLPKIVEQLTPQQFAEQKYQSLKNGKEDEAARQLQRLSNNNENQFKTSPDILEKSRSLPKVSSKFLQKTLLNLYQPKKFPQDPKRHSNLKEIPPERNYGAHPYISHPYQPLAPACVIKHKHFKESYDFATEVIRKKNFEAMGETVTVRKYQKLFYG